MNKKSILGLLIALALPLVCYLWLKVASDHAADVPRKYLLDTVLTRIEKGKEVTDSIWHKTANISLVNQLGDTVSIYDRSSKIMVVDYIFTSCRSICPKLTFNMQKLQHSFKLGGNVRNKIDTSVVQFVSFSVDPERDSVSVLKNYADLFGANHDNWWFLTGSKDSIYKFAFEELKVDQFSNEPISPDFVHTSRFILIDKKMQVRGYYNGLDSTSILKMAKDVGYLMLEKDKKKKVYPLTYIYFTVLL